MDIEAFLTPIKSFADFCVEDMILSQEGMAELNDLHHRNLDFNAELKALANVEYTTYVARMHALRQRERVDLIKQEIEINVEKTKDSINGKLTDAVQDYVRIIDTLLDDGHPPITAELLMKQANDPKSLTDAESVQYNAWHKRTFAKRVGAD